MCWGCHMQREGHRCGCHRVRRLMKLMRLVPICQGPRPARSIQSTRFIHIRLAKPGHHPARSSLVPDISYIPMRRGFLYLVAIMGWHSRKVSSWRLSNSMDAGFCVEALKEALAKYGPPEICNSDQGSQGGFNRVPLPAFASRASFVVACSVHG